MQSEETQGSSDTSLVRTKCCAKCNSVQPIRLFQYRATFQQTKSLGKVGKTRLLLESKYCKNCRPKYNPRRNSIQNMHPKKIKAKMLSGDLRIPERVLKDRVADGKDRMRHKFKQRVAKQVAEMWKVIYAPAYRELRLINAKLNRERSSIENKEKLTYLETTSQIMTRIVETLRYFKDKTPDLKTPTDYLKEINPNAITNPEATPTFDSHGWRIMLTQEDKQKITAAYNNIPDEVKRRFRTPLNLHQLT